MSSSFYSTNYFTKSPRVRFPSLLLMLATCGAGSFSQAQEANLEISPTQSTRQPVLKLSLGLDGSNFYYKEDLDPPGKSMERAQVLSPWLRLDMPGPQQFNSYFSLEAKVSTNVKTDYDGSTLSSGTPVQGKNPAVFSHAEAAWHFHLGESKAELSAGLGYHYWNRFLAGGTGYREIYTLLYFPLGAAYNIQFSPQWNAQLEATYQVMFLGQLQVITSETVTGGQDTTLDLGNRPGYCLRAKLQFEFSPQISISAQPWYEVYQIGESNTALNSTFGFTIREPPSQTVQSGLTLVGSYTFF